VKTASRSLRLAFVNRAIQPIVAVAGIVKASSGRIGVARVDRARIPIITLRSVIDDGAVGTRAVGTRVDRAGIAVIAIHSAAGIGGQARIEFETGERGAAAIVQDFDHACPNDIADFEKRVCYDVRGSMRVLGRAGTGPSAATSIAYTIVIVVPDIGLGEVGTTIVHPVYGNGSLGFSVSGAACPSI
jgi:hypothetical protein